MIVCGCVWLCVVVCVVACRGSGAGGVREDDWEEKGSDSVWTVGAGDTIVGDQKVGGCVCRMADVTPSRRWTQKSGCGGSVGVEMYGGRTGTGIVLREELSVPFQALCGRHMNGALRAVKMGSDDWCRAERML